MSNRDEQRKLNRKPYMECPACGCRCTVDSSEEQTHTLRVIYYRCDDIVCGHTFVAHLQFVNTLSPSSHGQINQTRRLVLRKAVEKAVSHPSALPAIGGHQPAPYDGPVNPTPASP